VPPPIEQPQEAVVETVEKEAEVPMLAEFKLG
jgi:hypothetical protein